MVHAQKKVLYEKENAQIKKLPVKQRKQARSKLKSRLKTRMKGVLRQLPAPGKMTMEQLSKLIQRAKSLNF